MGGKGIHDCLYTMGHLSHLSLLPPLFIRFLVPMPCVMPWKWELFSCSDALCDALEMGIVFQGTPKLGSPIPVVSCGLPTLVTPNHIAFNSRNKFTGMMIEEVSSFQWVFGFSEPNPPPPLPPLEARWSRIIPKHSSTGSYHGVPEGA